MDAGELYGVKPQDGKTTNTYNSIAYCRFFNEFTNLIFHEYF